MAGWTNLKQMFIQELVQLREEGRDGSAVERLATEAESARDDEQRLVALFEEARQVPMREDFPYREPSDLEGIAAGRTGCPELPKADLSEGALFDRMYGAWLLRCAGCALGKPVEVFMNPKGELSSRERLKRYLTAINGEEWPLRDYVPQHSPAEEVTGKSQCHASTREHIAFMETDDDIRYTVLGLRVLEEKGASFQTRDVAAMWLRQLPYAYVCTAETQAYRNLVWRYGHDAFRETSPVEIDWDWVAGHQNPYREWIGAQIRADAWGYAAPGRPELAAEFAWRDARLSHVKNGIYGEMFVAAMIAAAFVIDDPLQVVEAGLGQIPSGSRLHEDMAWTVELCRQHGLDAGQFEMVFDAIEAKLGHYDPVHTNNNAAVVTASLLLGGMDPHHSITLAVMGGWDTDCNGATVGSIVGASVGAAKLPKNWIEPLHDTLYAGMAEEHPIAISEAARRSVGVSRRVAGV